MQSSSCEDTNSTGIENAIGKGRLQLVEDHFVPLNYSTDYSFTRHSTPDSLELLDQTDHSNHSNSGLDQHSKMAQSRYAGVLFSNIQDSYPSDGEIECRFSVINKSLINEHGANKVGLYKVGWKSVNDCIGSHSCTESKPDVLNPNERRLKFSATILPEEASDSGDFYQFCYVTGDNEICGASSPFRVFRPNEDDFVELQNKGSTNDDGDDFVVIRSHQALLQERLQQLITDNGILEFSKRSLQHKVNALEKENNELKSQKMAADAKVQTLQDELRHVMSKFSLIQNREIEFDETLEQLQKELKKYKGILQEKETESQGLRTTLDMIQEEHDFITSKLAKTSSERSDILSENNILRSELEDSKTMLQTHHENKQLLLGELKHSEKQYSKLEDEVMVLRASLDSLKLTTDEKTDELDSIKESFRNKETKFQQQIAEMTKRLKEASEEYQALYKRNFKTENKLIKLQTKLEVSELKSIQ